MSKRRVTTSLQWIQQGPLVPWMYHYIQWLAQHPSAELSRPNPENEARPRRGPPKMPERTAAASRAAKRLITSRMIQVLEQRDDVIQYFEKLRADAQYLAREVARRAIATNLEIREEGLKRASARQEMPDGTVRYGKMDLKAVESFTRPYVDFAFPKKREDEKAAPRVTINLGIGPSDAKALLGKVLGEDEIADVEYELIEPKQLTDGEDDDAPEAR